MEARGGDRHRGAHVGDLNLRHAEAERPRDHERRRAARDGVGRELVAVAREAGHAEEQRSGLHRTVVVGEAADLDRRPFAEQISDGHPRAVYERVRRPTMALDGDRNARCCSTRRERAIGRYERLERDGAVYADLFARESGVALRAGGRDRAEPRCAACGSPATRSSGGR